MQFFEVEKIVKDELKKTIKCYHLVIGNCAPLHFLFFFIFEKEQKSTQSVIGFGGLALECSDSQHQAVHQVKINIDVNYCRWKNIYAFLIYPNSIKFVENYC